MHNTNELMFPLRVKSELQYQPIFGLLVCLCLFSLGTLNAAMIDLVNPSFEDTSGSVPFNEFTFGPPMGWQIYDPSGIVLNNGVGPEVWVGTLAPNPPTFFDSPAPDGSRVAILYNRSSTGGLGEYGIQQTLSEVLFPNTRYRLQVEIGNIASGTAVSGEFFDLDGFPGYRVDLMAGSSVIASDNNLLAGFIDEGRWGTSTIEFHVESVHPMLGQPLGIRLVSLNLVDPSFPSADLEVDFDHVRLWATSVPEPSSISLVPIFAFALTIRRR